MTGLSSRCEYCHSFRIWPSSLDDKKEIERAFRASHKEDCPIFYHPLCLFERNKPTGLFQKIRDFIFN